MGFLPDTQNCGLRMRRKCRERFPRQRELAIPTCITARAWRTCRDACRDRWLAVLWSRWHEENLPGIPGACANHNFAYLVRGPLQFSWIVDEVKASVGIMTWLCGGPVQSDLVCNECGHVTPYPPGQSVELFQRGSMAHISVCVCVRVCVFKNIVGKYALRS